MFVNRIINDKPGFFAGHGKYRTALMAVLLVMIDIIGADAQQTALSKLGIEVIPYPRQVQILETEFLIDPAVTLVLDKSASAQDRFAAEELIRHLREETGVSMSITDKPGRRSIVLTRRGADKRSGEQGYSLKVGADRLTISARTEAGLFYGVQTLLQLVQKKGSEYFVKGMDIVDWPDTRIRAVHYDTKHHQDKREYVEELIRELSRYKINMLVWEWEDKFLYPSHPEIGAPGAFTMEEMQAFTQYARKYHVQLVPLVQGLGHVSFILKWPQYAHLRELYASNFEFCPLKEGSYALLQDLWKDAMKATPGAEYIHIGSDETYELGLCADCKKKEAEIGKSGLYHLFVANSAKPLQEAGRKVMVWESPMGWEQAKLWESQKGWTNDKTIVPRKGIVLTEEYEYETPDLEHAKKARSLGYPVFAYDPNPGIEQIFLPYFYSEGSKGAIKEGCFQRSYDFLTSRMGKGVFDGMIRTSWDDSGLPVQAWMLSFATAAAFSWNASAPKADEFIPAFLNNYYGKGQADNMHQLYRLLNEGAYYYMNTLERKVWAWGPIGKTHLPDLPRTDALEYDPYWNIEYADQVEKAAIFLKKMDTAVAVGKNSIAAGARHTHDIELFISIAGLVRHTALTYLDLSNLERSITQAHQQRFVSHDSTWFYLNQAEEIVKNNIERRNSFYAGMVDLWEKTRLPKGLSTPEKPYFFRQDRTRHFANRTPDLKYHIIDEEDLDLEGYLERLRAFKKIYHETFMGSGGETSATGSWPVPR